ncbi:hypothetical protein FF011L_26050 [Roseimaritima multifibrata]|uniref:OstA-like protein n=1 Tax=Roseimaritima multifibrata TaxID=1930274 RepID=A0A517MG17_9BACT|nr:hypothetical protein [Roseimaritima multifibrata]QDS93831.1 hypothetical protein FF011L_26050 [Roseimaritima multifibrata]
MPSKLLNYSLALGLLSLLTVVYQLTFVSWIKQEEVTFAPISNINHSAEPSVVELMFAEGTWQHDARKRLSLKDQGVILFGERKQVSPTQWRVWPVAVVMRRSGAPPIIMEAAEGADVTFSEPLEVMGSKAPPIKSGQLVGKVTIRSAPAIHGQSIPLRDQLEIETKDVGIDNQRIWTNEELKLRWGESVLIGRNLEIRLAGGGSIPTSGGQSPLAILDSMELVYLDRLQMPVPGKRKKTDDPNTVVPNGVASIKCAGRVTFDFATDLLRLRDAVQIRHQPHVGPEDLIECDAVTIEFNNPLAGDIDRTSTADWLKRIEAIGQPVIAKLPTAEAEMVAESVVYDTDEGTVRVQGSAGVRIQYQDINFQVTDFAYHFSASDPTQIGTLDCKGSGLLDFKTNDAMAVKTVRWNKGVQLRPLPEPGKHELLVDGKVTTTLADGGEILADILRFTFRQKPEPASPPGAPATNGIDKASGMPTFEPEQASATGNVVFNTTLMYAETKLLQLFFTILPESETDQTVPPGLKLNPASGKKKRLWVRQPDDSEDSVSPVARPRPTLTADSMHASITLVNNEVTSSDLSVMGNVRLDHQLATPQSVLPLKVAGDKLRIVSKGGHDMMQINGDVTHPARFDLGDGYFIGPLIRVSTSDNYVWINQAGECQMPSGLLPVGPDATMKWTAPPRCSWAGEMYFDGQQIELSGGVQLTAKVETIPAKSDRAQAPAKNSVTPWNMIATGDRMTITLDQAVQIASPETGRQAKLNDVSLIGSEGKPVYLTADQSNDKNQLVARHVLHMPRLTLKPNTGLLEAPGPGWYRNWSVPAPDGPLAKFVPQGGLMGTHLVFAEKMEGDLNQQELRFHNGVRIGISPVVSWESTFEATEMTSLEAGQATIDCQILRIAQSRLPSDVAGNQVDPRTAGMISSDPTKTNKLGALEIEALGGVIFRARNERGLFDCSGERASYAAAKDLFMIEGDGRKAATFKQTQPNGQPGMNVSLPYIKVWPKTMEIDAELQHASPGTLPAHMQAPGR